MQYHVSYVQVDACTSVLHSCDMQLPLLYKVTSILAYVYAKELKICKIFNYSICSNGLIHMIEYSTFSHNQEQAAMQQQLHSNKKIYITRQKQELACSTTSMPF